MSQSVDLTNCDREPIHIPGSVQAHGCLLACDASGTTVLRHSLNAPAMLGFGADLNGQTLSGLFGGDAVHEIRNGLARSDDPARPGLLTGITLNGRVFDIACHRHKGHVILEFEPAALQADNSPLQITRALIGRLVKTSDPDQLIKRASVLLRSLLGYDRVMIYQFAEDGSGQVVSEAKREDLESFLGQHFPASDIPKQARELYLRNTIRVISDASGARSLLEPVLDASGEPLDLSFAHLRSVSPVHLEYLRNMGVGASMSVSIVIRGVLWGLVACHHYSARPLPMAHRVAAEMFGEFFALHLEAMNNRRRHGLAVTARAALDRLLSEATLNSDIDGLLRANLDAFGKLMPFDGVGVWMNGRWSSKGATPPENAIAALARVVAEQSEGRVWATNELSSVTPAAAAYASEAAGVLAVPLSQLPRDFLFFFRREVVQTVEWAGNPEKTYEHGPLGDRLTPRKSFAIWKETVEGKSKPWTAADREIAEAARASLVEIAMRHNELLADERMKAEVRQKMLNEELNHRVKNILALIKSLVAYPADRSVSLEAYLKALHGRIQALSFAHDQVVRGDGGGALRDLLEAELTPHRTSAGQVTLKGPAVLLDSRAFSVMALVLHEMATNAAKYGALSRPGGEVSVTWSVDETGACDLVWRESHGPVVRVPEKPGFGSVLIQRSIPYDLGGESEIAYPPGGVKARFRLPPRFLSVIEESAEAASKAQPAPVSVAGDDASALKGLHVLLLEDQLLIAMDCEAMLEARGVASVQTASNTAAALRILARSTPDVAVLDVNLGEETSQTVAEALVARGIPFVFATGYADAIVLPEGMGHVPLVRKPYDADTLSAGLARARAMIT